ncbi:MAG: RluA family pseudouridine synthase [Syntrophorhabdaceae bacterium]|nr:RluA family pseudouridine synthase [Syntrophorhabdaceae bacterium]
MSERGEPFSLICDAEGIRLDIFLSERLSLTRTKAKGMIEGGFVHIQGKIPKPSMKTKKGMEIEGEIPEEEPLSLIPQAIPLDIIYEDEYLIAINKPKNMVVHPSLGHKESTLLNAVLGYLGIPDQTPLEGSVSPRPYLIHRLDKDTTGVILVSKNMAVRELFSTLFKNREVKKTYRAIVEGLFKEKEGTIEGNIGRHPGDRKRMAVLKEGGREALTSYRVLEETTKFSYLEIYPKTGRTHQIRVHMAHIGHPVVGDEMYGKTGKHEAERTMLHAFRIEFIHPVKNIPVSIEAPIPEDMVSFIMESKKG